MNDQNLDRAENAIDKTQWKIDSYADRARDYIREQREKNLEPTAEGWTERAKANISDAWDDTKDAVADAWEKTKNWADDAWDATKDAAHDAKNEVDKATN